MKGQHGSHQAGESGVSLQGTCNHRQVALERQGAEVVSRAAGVC